MQGPKNGRLIISLDLSEIPLFYTGLQTPLINDHNAAVLAYTLGVGYMAKNLSQWFT